MGNGRSEGWKVYLKHSHTCSSLPLPILWFRIESFQYIEGLRSVHEVTHAVAIVGDELEKVERLVRTVHLGGTLQQRGGGEG